ncbi:hypothetical protein AAG747_13285 [Rapidithrix thailandica]|uniref:ATP-grasp fold RimK-type domain-containing protein n=1 Tax=Rapidithrix thailandica TaxID=413964 RepID=A0AAW9S7G6_9BACT
MNLRKRLSLLWTKWLHYEYWPFWFFYAPMLPYGLYLALKARSLSYFTTVNPGVEYGGLVEASKVDLLQQIAPEYLPKMLFVSQNHSLSQIIHQLSHAKLSFPLIAKPNMGERGLGVELLKDTSALGAYLKQSPRDFLLQEYISFEIELGVLYYRYPESGESGITSVVLKEFLKVVGDGTSTVKELMEKNLRATFRQEYLEEKFAEQLHTVLAKGVSLQLEPIGNHCRGTKFLNGNHLINPHLVKVFDSIAAPVKGYYYGRFDLKVKSMEELYLGRNLKIMELNGVQSEPAHIYDPHYSLFQAYRDVARHMRLIYQISQESYRKGAKRDSLGAILGAIRKHYKESKAPHVLSRQQRVSPPFSLGTNL